MKKISIIIFSSLIAVLAFITGVAILLVSLDKLNWFGSNAFWYGADFIPAFWLLIPAVIVGIGLLALKKIKLSLAWLIIYLFFFLSFGDYSFKSILPKTMDLKSGTTLKIGALNVQYYSHGLKTVIDSIKKMNTDVMLISENVLTPEQEEQLPLLLKGYYFFKGHQNSTAIISRYPLINSKEIDLPSIEASLCDGNDLDTMKSNFHRSFVYSSIDVNGKTVHLISVRFIAGRPKNKTINEQIRWGKYLVSTQMQEVSSFLSFLKNLNGPVIFGGDLNAPPGSKTMDPIYSIAKDAYLTDHFFGLPTFRTQFPTLRLDYLFGMNGAIPLNSKIVSMEISDHFPIISDFFIQNNEQRAAN